ncbi:MAG: response regulator [Dermatophilaceae bacterium]|nr:response regulator [Dermatophilaceae bacterium]
MSAAAAILIVDDESQNCRLLEALLVPEGYDTRTAASGEDALVSIAKDPPDLILLDVMMPGPDGRQVARALKADPATANIPIIMVTAQTDREARLAGLEAGAEDFLTKPVDRAELWLRVRNLLRLKELSDLLEHHRGTLEAEVAARTAELQEAFEAARSMIESSLDALVAISPEGLITDANEATVKATGVPRQELIGTAFSQCFTEPEKAKAIYQLVFEKGMAVDYPLTMRHRDGTLTEVLYNASVYRDGGGKVLGVFAAARDVTEQNRAETELAEQRLNELERMADLERFQRLTVGRELKMIELKKENEYLKKFGPGDGAEPSEQR